MTESQALTITPMRYARKVTDGAGLYLLITPNDHRYWRYQYRFEGRQKTLAIGVYPDISLQVARGRHRFARRLLADGIDPSTLKRTLGKHAFAVAAREWLIQRRQKLARRLTDDLRVPNLGSMCFMPQRKARSAKIATPDNGSAHRERMAAGPHLSDQDVVAVLADAASILARARPLRTVAASQLEAPHQSRNTGLDLAQMSDLEVEL